MCGIIGCWHKNKEPVSESLLFSMRDRMFSRGPDDAGVWFNDDKTIALGHRRLSILDLSSLGHQPMKSAFGDNVITYNGEIYNYLEIRKELEKDGFCFKSNCDTEVVIASYQKWGMNCVKHFNGMFVFAIWDNAKRGMFLARDRIGKKPLYYFNDENRFLFASQISSLLLHPACPREVEKNALSYYLQIGFVPAPLSMVKNVVKMQAAHVLWIDSSGITEQCYWNADMFSIDPSLESVNEKDIIDKFDFLLRDAVRKRLLSDVPLGAFLSGGIDSSLVTSLMCQVSSNRPKTFTIGFDNEKFNEAPFAREVAQYLNTDHYEKIMTPEDLLNLMEDNTFHYDEPFADWSSLPTMLLSKFTRSSVTVALSGDGGDELFAGYHYYSILKILHHMKKIPSQLRLGISKILKSSGQHQFILLGNAMENKSAIDSFAFMRTMSKDFDIGWLMEERGNTISDLFSERNNTFPTEDDVSRACRLDMAYFLTDDILKKVDVASMAASLEVRSPILDYRIVEFALSLPVKYKLRGLTSKYLMKKILGRYLPQNLIKRKKKGFVLPLHQWFRHELKDMLLSELCRSKVEQFPGLRFDAVKQLVDIHLSGKRDTHPMLWSLICLIRWNEKIRNFPAS